tara:strand:- start:347 stop:484 length:138 start_codon:yes stop_codon:yes gene_type:complete
MINKQELKIKFGANLMKILIKEAHKEDTSPEEYVIKVLKDYVNDN